jgi:Rhodopirellula transposase DDE domain
MIDARAIRLRWEADGSKRDERGRRLFAASEARAAGWGGVAAVAGITGLARSRIIRGLKDLDAAALQPGRVRREGGGRRTVTATDSTLLGDLARLVEPATMGDPMRSLMWVSKSREKLADELGACGHSVSPNTVGRLLVDELEYSRQTNRKTHEGAGHPDRNAQFEHINAQVIAAQAAGQPVISVDTKKKELIGNFRNAGTDYRPKGDPVGVNVHDFKDKELGKVVPHGIYDPTANVGWVSVGITHDTAEFAVQSIRTWLDRIGRPRYASMRELMITADCGGSNNARSRLWKVELQKLADETAMPIKVCHYPPGTSKWNKIEHRLFCHITQNWRARPLTSRAAVLELIAATTTKTGLRVECALDARNYEKGIKITNAEMVALDIRGDTFHPEWNYTIHPRPAKS